MFVGGLGLTPGGLNCCRRLLRMALHLPAHACILSLSDLICLLSAPPLPACPHTAQEAYVALLSNEVSEVQLDCLHRLIAGLCAAEGGVELLCRLPFAHNFLVSFGSMVAVMQ